MVHQPHGDERRRRGEDPAHQDRTRPDPVQQPCGHGGTGEPAEPPDETEHTERGVAEVQIVECVQHELRLGELGDQADQACHGHQPQHQRVAPQPAHPLGQVGTQPGAGGGHRAVRVPGGVGPLRRAGSGVRSVAPARLGASAWPVAARHPDQERGPQRERDAVQQEGERMEHREGQAAHRATEEGLAHDLGGLELAVGTGETVLADHRGDQHVRRAVRDDLGGTHQQRGEVDQPDRGGVEVHQCRGDTDRGRAGGVGQHDRLAAVHAVQHRARGQAEQQPGQELGRRQPADEQRVPGDECGEQREGGLGDAVAEIGERVGPEQPGQPPVPRRRHRRGRHRPRRDVILTGPVVRDCGRTVATPIRVRADVRRRCRSGARSRGPR